MPRVPHQITVTVEVYFLSLIISPGGLFISSPPFPLLNTKENKTKQKKTVRWIGLERGTVEVTGATAIMAVMVVMVVMVVIIVTAVMDIVEIRILTPRGTVVVVVVVVVVVMGIMRGRAVIMGMITIASVENATATVMEVLSAAEAGVIAVIDVAEIGTAVVTVTEIGGLALTTSTVEAGAAITPLLQGEVEMTTTGATVEIRVGQQIAFPFEKPFMFSNENIDGMKTIQEWAIKETIGHAERTTLLPRLW
jgi:hypothetical protein